MATFLDVYTTKATAGLAALAGRPLTDAEMDRIDAIVRSRFRDRPAVVSNPHRNTRVETTLGQVAEWAPRRTSGGESRPAVWTGHGTMFKPQSEADSVMGRMLQKLLDERKVAKKIMLDLIRAGILKSDPKVKAKDQEQKIWKLLANSWFGAQGERGFHFFNPAMGPAITYTGRLAISATIWGFEAFLEGNCWIQGPDELASHVAACISHIPEDSLLPWEEWGESGQSATVEAVADRLRIHCAPGWDCAEAARQLAVAAGERGRWALLYRGNPLAFSDLPVCQELIGAALAGEIKEPDAEKMQEQHPEGKVALDRLWEGMERWVMPPWLPSDGPKRVMGMRRKSVVLADTDSSFVSLGPWVDFLHSRFDFTEATDGQKLTAVNSMIYLLTILSREQCGMLTRNLNVQPDRRKRLSFKNEFIFKRVIITNGKKHYLGLQTHKEGATLASGGETEFKGLAMKKSVVPKSTSKYLEKMCEEKLLRPDVLDRSGMVKAIVELDSRVRDSISSGDCEYATPVVLGNIASYKNPYAMPVVRGTMAWNAANPQMPIRQSDRVNSFRLKVGSDAGALADAMESFPEGSSDRKALAAIADKFFGERAPAELSGPGLNWICIPKEVRRMPAWLLPLVNVEDAARANVSPALPVLEAIGVRPLTNPDPEVYSSTIAF